MATKKLKIEDSPAIETSIDCIQATSAFKYNVTIVMGWKTQEQRLRASSQVLSSISSVWKDMLIDVGENEEKVWRCDRGYYDGLKVIIELAHHTYESQEALKRETIQLIGILCHKFRLYRLLRSHLNLWAPFFVTLSIAEHDPFQLQMRFYIAEALGCKVHFEAAWRDLLARATVGNEGKLCLIDDDSTSSEAVNDVLITNSIRVSLLKARLDFMHELKCLVTTLTVKLMDGHSFCQINEKPSTLEAKKCELWMLNQLNKSDFSGCIGERVIGASRATTEDADSVPAHGVVEVLQALKNEWQTVITPMGHTACKQAVFDQIEALEKKLDSWALPSDVMDRFEDHEPKKVRKREWED